MMKTIDLKNHPMGFDELLAIVQDEDVLIMEEGHCRARIEKFDDEDLDDWLFEHDPQTIRDAETARVRWKDRKGAPLDQLRNELER